MTSPILFLIFNRPDTTTIVFESIRAAQPPRLYVAADGARKSKEGEEEICRQVRQIATQIDWPCEVKTLFRDTNLGCGKAVSEAITWFFEHEEMGIILEDDCLADQSFYGFCDVLLDKYKNEKSVMHIGGTIFIDYLPRNGESYFFSQFSHIWGWASWRDRWQYYDLHLVGFNLKRDTAYYNFSQKALKYFNKRFHQVSSGKINTWDYQWNMTIWRRSGICVMPSVNLVTNIGFGEDATHTTTESSSLANIKSKSINSIQHPIIIERNKKADDEIFVKLFFRPSTYYFKIIALIKHVIKKIFPN